MRDVIGVDVFPCAFGRFTLVDKITEGGMAEIFLALEDMPHGGRRFVTLKRIRREYVDDPDFVDFFITEGTVSIKCAHPNLPHAIELGQIDGRHYLAMEYIPGHTLLKFLRGALKRRHWPSVNAALTIGIGLAAALEHAHDLRDVTGAPMQVIHRDVTPQNIILTAAGSVKLIDFGIVRSVVQRHKTQVGIVKGKYAYMAPEQLDSAPDLDHRADLFALGVVLHEILCARPLFRGKSDLDTCDRVRMAPIPDPSEIRPDVPRELAALVLKSLARDARRRFQSATDMLSALEYVAERCSLPPSLVRMREELLINCGPPRVPILDDDMVARIEKQRRASEPPARPASPQILQATGAHAAFHPRRGEGLQRDPLLRYFLRKSQRDDDEVLTVSPEPAESSDPVDGDDSVDSDPWHYET